MPKEKEKKKKVKFIKPTPKELKDIKQVLDTRKALKVRIEIAEKRALEIMLKGFKIKGYGLIPAVGNRTWKEGITEAKIFSKLKKWIDDKSDVSELKLKSPAVIEQYFPEVSLAIDKLATLTEREDKGKKLAEDAKKDSK